MTQYLVTELRKLFSYRTFWLFLLLYMGLLLLIMFSASRVQINNQAVGDNLYVFPDIWATLTYIASNFNLLLGILFITLITDEYAYRTIRQQVIDGLFRSDIILNKFWVVLLIGAFCSLYVFGLGLGFGLQHTPAVTPAKVLSGSLHVVYYLVQALGYMSIAVFFAFLIRRNGLTIIAYLVYTKIIEPLIHWQVPDELDKYFPMKVFSSLTPMPGKEVFEAITGPAMQLSPQQAVVPALIYIFLFYLLSYLLLKVRDL